MLMRDTPKTPQSQERLKPEASDIYSLLQVTHIFQYVTKYLCERERKRGGERERKMPLSLSPLLLSERILPLSKIVRLAWLEGESQ